MLHALHHINSSKQWKVWNVRVCTLQNGKNTLKNEIWTPLTPVLCSLYSIEYSFYSVHYTIYRKHCTVYSTQYTVKFLQCTVHSSTQQCWDCGMSDCPNNSKLNEWRHSRQWTVCILQCTVVHCSVVFCTVSYCSVLHCSVVKCSGNMGIAWSPLFCCFDVHIMIVIINRKHMAMGEMKSHYWHGILSIKH